MFHAIPNTGYTSIMLKALSTTFIVPLLNQADLLMQFYLRHPRSWLKLQR